MLQLPIPIWHPCFLKHILAAVFTLCPWWSFRAVSTRIFLRFILRRILQFEYIGLNSQHCLPFLAFLLETILLNTFSVIDLVRVCCIMLLRLVQIIILLWHLALIRCIYFGKSTLEVRLRCVYFWSLNLLAAREIFSTLPCLFKLGLLCHPFSGVDLFQLAYFLSKREMLSRDRYLI